MRARTVTLTAAQHSALVRTRDRDPRPYLRERAGALLKIAAGQSPRQVALTGLARRRRPKTVNGWLDAYLAAGLAGLVQQPRGHRGFSPSAGRGVAGDGTASASQLRGEPGTLAAGRPAPGRELGAGLLAGWAE